ncbi:hypothetical protein V5O48_013402 [Marasmius crinis-equi]|uniref:G domain-containing protein n=1 Tax=Marasmius crinis-equi TaxID=585013 RepID=A0ABR3F0K4_9AGAR
MASSGSARPPTRKLSEGTIQAPHTRINMNLHAKRPDEVVAAKCRRFRVLVMGRRNAGKTTLLKNMTQSSDGKVEMHNEEGYLVEYGKILEPSVERGQSRIDWEITYPSNPGFVFHDSRGMEAGSTEEIERLKEFMEKRSKETSLEDQLHVIWYCLPLDSDRPLCREEMAFFENGTYGVPVVAIFTKFEARINKAFGALRDEGDGPRQARRRAPAKARADFQQHVLDKRIPQMRYKPATYVYLQGRNALFIYPLLLVSESCLLPEMNEPNADCSDLTRATHNVVQNEVVSLLFAQIQRQDVQISLGVALVYAMSLTAWRYQQVTKARNRLHEWTALLLSLFPHWNVADHECIRVIHDSVHSWVSTPTPLPSPQATLILAITSQKDTTSSTKLQLLTYFIDVLAIAECLFWIGGSAPHRIDLIKRVINEYAQSTAFRSQRLIARTLEMEMNKQVLGLDTPLYRDRLRNLAMKYEKLVFDNHFELDTPPSPPPKSGRLTRVQI